MSNSNEFSDQMEWNILASENYEKATIELENTDFQENLSNKRLTVDFGYFENESLPLFIPAKRESFPTLSPTPFAVYNDTLNVNSIDYSIRMTNTNNGNVYVWYLEWTPELPEPAPPAILQTQEQYFQTKYYWGKSTVHFAQVLTNAIQDLAVLAGVFSPSQGCQIVVGASAFGLIMNQVFIQTGTGYTLEFSNSLDELFLLQSVYSDENYKKIVFSLNTITYASQSCTSSQGLSWSNKWFPYQQILITSDLSLRKIQRQTNFTQNSTSFFNTNYKNIILMFNILEPNPNQIYPYFEYITESSNTKDIYFENDLDLRLTYNVRVYLLNIKKNILTPYTLNKNELINLKLRHFTKK